jgi:hypothetical protein
MNARLAAAMKLRRLPVVDKRFQLFVAKRHLQFNRAPVACFLRSLWDVSEFTLRLNRPTALRNGCSRSLASYPVFVFSRRSYHSLRE